jgi:hypothetical protein
MVSYAGLTRVSIYFAKAFHEMMDRRVKPGNDEYHAVIPGWAEGSDEPGISM